MSGEQCRGFVIIGPLGVQCAREPHPDDQAHRVDLKDRECYAADTPCSVHTNATVAITWDSPVAISRASCDIHGFDAERIADRTGVRIQ